MSTLLPCPRCGSEKIEFTSELPLYSYATRYRATCSECFWSPGSANTLELCAPAWNNPTIRAWAVEQRLTIDSKKEGETS